MAQPRSTRRCPEPPARRNEAESADRLDLPVAPDFISLPPTVSLDQALLLIEQIRSWFPEAVPTAEEREAARVHAEFVL